MRRCLALSWIGLGLSTAAPGCDHAEPSPAGAAGASSAAPVVSESAAAAGPSTATGDAGSASAQDVGAAARGDAGAGPNGRCADGMARIPGARFKVGSNPANAAPEETPPFETEVATFCLDLTEVTVTAYAKCVEAGACKTPRTDRRFCNVRAPDRGDHPMNCVDWHEAAGYCAWRSARLPSEVEWEYAARGGTEYRSYSWGNEGPEGRTCWKHVGGSCKVREFPAGAFGLFDMIGNVWEWTDDWFGEYPWPPSSGFTKVYRGGSWSRRFVKWMSPRLRNRFRPDEWGSHLGFRCASTPADVTCPYGRSDDGKKCVAGVLSADCAGRAKWNGVRCALPGEPECAPGSVKQPGHGCALEAEIKGPAPEVETTPVVRVRSPEFDGDCAQNKPGRPHAYRYSGGTHHARNRVSGSAGCANRDVGVGWNSTCCP